MKEWRQQVTGFLKILRNPSRPKECGIYSAGTPDRAASPDALTLAPTGAMKRTEVRNPSVGSSQPRLSAIAPGALLDL
jgi:hypothetical protein